jgi:hypothetical protein
VPADVAVHQPCARVVSLEGEDEVTAGGQHSGVSTGRVAQVQRDRIRVRS